MNILFLALSFSTKEHKSFYEDLLREFQRNGHKIYVACANEKRSNEIDGIQESDGIHILRVRTGNITGNLSIIEKGLSTVSIDFLFQRAIRKYWGNVHFDLVMYPTPPITLVNTVNYVKNKNNAKTYLLLKDIFPQNAVDLGMMTKTGPKAVLYRFFRAKEKKLYRISDYIGCMSPANCRYVIEHNPEVDPKKVEVCPNCVAVPEELSWNRDNRELKEKYGIPADAKVFIYGGNLGKPQGIPFLMQCLEREKDNEKAFFIIVGSGSEYKKLQNFMETVKPKNSLLLSHLPKEEYKQLANQCDIGMIFLDHRFTIPNFPSRLLSCLAAGIPVLVATDTASDMGPIAEENGFGYWCESNDVEDFHNAVQKMLNSDQTAMGKKGWIFLLNSYTVDNVYRIILKHFEERKGMSD